MGSMAAFRNAIALYSPGAAAWRRWPLRVPIINIRCESVGKASVFTGPFVSSQPHAKRRLHCGRIACASSSVETAVAPPQPKRIRQALDFTCLAASVSALKTWVPSRVDEVVQWSHSCVALRLTIPDSQGWLHFSWDPLGARVCIGKAPERGKISEAFSFGERLHANLRGLILMDVDLPASFERVVQFKFGKRLGGELEYSLWCEVMGKYSNLLLVDSSSTILLCARQVGSKLSSLRLLQDGGQYVLPPEQNGLSPNAYNRLEQWVDVVKQTSQMMMESAKTPKTDMPVASAIVRSFQGVSPYLANELLEKCNIQQNTLISEMEPEKWQLVFDQFSNWLTAIDSGNFTASLCSATGRYSVLGSFDQPFDGVHHLLDEYYGSIGEGDEFSRLHQQLRSCVNQNLKKLQKKVNQLEKAVVESEKAAQTQKQADLIMANVHKWERGATEMEVEDWETGASIKIKLDPLKTAVEVAQGLYKKGKKQKRGVNAVAPLLDLSKGELTYFQEVEESLNQLQKLDDGDDMKAIEEIKDELISLKYMKPPPEYSLASKAASKAKKAKQRQKQKPGGNSNGDGSSEGFRACVSPNGFRVLVGRNSRQNDQLSKEVAKNDDLWFHARGVPGSHVVLKLDGKGEAPSKEDVQFAAEVAAWFSKAKDAGKVGVIKAFGKDVIKPKGAKPGLVLVSKEEVVLVKPRNNTAQ
ncbi:hypothetical protein BSKO_04282 [Bryopsis sp. KO-2023]|nr:hypothetical protein BSKO_04282 [Bryopsis sp. KO-2023]